MAQAHASARSGDRETLPIELRVYGLEGITQTQDEAIGQHAVTLAAHDARLGSHDVQLAVQGTNQTTMQKTMDALVTEMQKTRWTLVGFAFTVAAAALGVGLL